MDRVPGRRHHHRRNPRRRRALLSVRRRRLFLLGGLGVGRLDIEIDGFGSAGETGSGAILGLGWDIRVAPNVSLTPFWNGIGIKVTDGDANFGQIGIGLTIH
jgi:hypothetical protein